MQKKFFPVAVPDIGEHEQALVLEAVRSGWVSSIGEFLNRFEQRFAAFCEATEGVAVANGTVAIEVTLKALGVGPGDEVVVPGMTFAAVAAVVVHLGAEPVLADVHPEYWCVDPAAVERAITARTKAVVAVHSYGHPADMEAILDLCRARGIHVIEDSAEAHGARCRGRRVGGIGTAGCFSFYGNKIVTTGEGGIVTTDDHGLADRIRVLKDHAMDPRRRYYHLEAGYNYRMTNVQAALGCAQLDRVEEFLAKRAEILRWYRSALDGVTGIRLNPVMPWAEPVNWIVCVVLDGRAARRRDDLLARLRERGVDTRPFFVPMGDMPPYRGARQVGAEKGGNPVASRLASSGFNLPTSVTLTREDVDFIVSALRGELDAVDRL